MTNTYDIKGNKKKMLESGKSQKEADEWEVLVTEITQAIASKQLVPTMRTQYMRTAFQIPFDATVRISLDTNLCMISERGYNLQNMRVWHRDSSEILAKDEITRFPHAILEIKIELKGENMTPPKWLTALQNSGMLYEVSESERFTSSSFCPRLKLNWFAFYIVRLQSRQHPRSTSFRSFFTAVLCCSLIS
jgi:SPX domain protein involved in polyphosphate accumulation